MKPALAFLCGFLLAWLLDLHHVQRRRMTVRIDAPDWSWRDLERVDAV